MNVKNETLQHLVAFNGFRGGNKGSVSSQPLSEYDKAIRYPWLHEMVLQIRGEKSIRSVDNADPKALAKAQQRIKAQLPFRCTHYSRFLENKRRQDHIDPESFLFQTTVDVDEKEYVDKAIARAKELDTLEYLSQESGEGGGATKTSADRLPNPWRGMLLHLEYSARKKLHIDIRMPIGMTIEETQRSYCEALGVPCDESCFSPERIIFITDIDSEIYRSPHWYEVLGDEEIARRRQAFLDRGLSIDGRDRDRSGTRIPTVDSSLAGDCKSPGTPDGGGMPDGYKSPGTPDGMGAPDGVKSKSVRSVCKPSTESVASPASEKNLIAFDLIRERAGLKNVPIDVQGSRHSSLLAILSAGASRIMTEEELRKVLLVKMPIYGTEPNCHQLVHDFYTKYGDNSKPMSMEVIRINAQAEKASGGAKVAEMMATGGAKVSADLKSAEQASSLQANYPEPPKMPEHLPKLVELLISKTPEEYKPAVANAIFPPLATHLWNVRFNYIDNVEHEATLMCCLLAGTGAGKSCVQKPINLIMEDIRKRDRENLEREKAWKDEITRKGANKDKRKRPQNLIIQEIDADMTNPAFVMRTAEAQGHFLYTSLNEIDQFDALKGTGNQQFRIMCYAFDPDNQYGQTRVGTQSVTERVTIRFNWNASTTIEMGQRYFSKVLTNGPLSRINFCTIPEREIGEEMPIYGTYDETFKEALAPYIENLCKATGLIDCPEAFALAKKLKDENAEFSRLCQDRIYENFSFRANVIGYLKACVLYVANGCQWEKEMDEFIRWSERYDLYCKMRFFADAIKKHNEQGEKSSKRGPSNLLQLLPDEFNYLQAMQVRASQGLSQDGTKNMINQWSFRGYIERVEREGDYNYRNYSYRKLVYRKDGLRLD